MREEWQKQMLEMMKSILPTVNDKQLFKLKEFTRTALDDIIEEMANRDLKVIVVK